MIDLKKTDIQKKIYPAHDRKYAKRDYHPWTQGEEALLMYLIDTLKLTHRKAADRLQRSYSVIVRKRGELLSRSKNQ